MIQKWSWETGACSPTFEILKASVASPYKIKKAEMSKGNQPQIFSNGNQMAWEPRAYSWNIRLLRKSKNKGS